MLYWQANFQIPNSGVQTAEVYAFASLGEKSIEVSFYGDSQKSNLLFVKEYELNQDIEDAYEYLLLLDDFSNYTKV